MALSNLTVAELQAAAMLMGDGWYYAPDDHTFNCDVLGPDYDGLSKEVCPDTLEELPSGQYLHRKKMVRDGVLGASDYLLDNL